MSGNGARSIPNRAGRPASILAALGMLLVPMSYESRVLGVIVLSKAGFDQFSEDDQRTLEIFAGHAAQAFVNAEAFEQVRRQQQELHHRLESQRRLLEVNERLLATLDPSGILEMIADSLKVVVSYDALTVYRPAGRSRISYQPSVSVEVARMPLVSGAVARTIARRSGCPESDRTRPRIAECPVTGRVSRGGWPPA